MAAREGMRAWSRESCSSKQFRNQWNSYSSSNTKQQRLNCLSKCVQSE